MTGFGKFELSNDEYIVAIEIKSVNHRFKEIKFKIIAIEKVSASSK